MEMIHGLNKTNLHQMSPKLTFYKMKLNLNSFLKIYQNYFKKYFNNFFMCVTKIDKNSNKINF